MAFHVACPRRVCDCELWFGAARGKKKAAGAWAEAAAAAALEGFLANPWVLRPADGPEAGTVQIEVPPLDLQEEGEDEAHRAVVQRQAAAAEDFARRLEGAHGSPIVTQFKIRGVNTALH